MVPFAVGELDDLVLDRRAVAGADARDFPRVQGRQMQVFADDRAHLRGRMPQVADTFGFSPCRGCTWKKEPEAHRRAGPQIGSIRCCRHAAASGVPVFKRMVRNPGRVQFPGQLLGRRFVGPAGGIGRVADEYSPVQECPVVRDRPRRRQDFLASRNLTPQTRPFRHDDLGRPWPGDARRGSRFQETVS